MLMSTDPLRPRQRFVVILIATLLVESGCDHVHSGQQSTSSSIVGERQLTFNIGVVSSELEGYRCISFDELGLEDSSIIREIRTSCECVVPRVVRYLSASGQDKPAVFLRLKPDSQPSATEASVRTIDFSAANLSVLIELFLESGEKRCFNLDFIHTRIRDGVAE